MDAAKIIRNLGGPTQVAKLCQISTAAVRQWRVNGIPAARRQYLQLLRPEAFGPAQQCACSPSAVHDAQEAA